MGQAMWPSLRTAPDIHVVAALGRHAPPADLPADTAWVHHLADALAGAQSGDLWVDLTTGEAATQQLPEVLAAGCDALVGATGMSADTLANWAEQARVLSRTVFVVPNFSLGAVLMMRFATMAARWLPDVEIVEAHHPGKKDAPSGTARRTAELVASARQSPPLALPCGESLPPSRGLNVSGIPVHAIRLPGLLAHQEVVFGGTGEVLTLRHDAMSRECFAPGLLLAIRGMSRLSGLVVGLEHLLEGEHA